MFALCATKVFSGPKVFQPKQHYTTSAQESVTKLSNGVKVASELVTGETTSVGVFIKTGSSYETESNNGISNFFRNIAAKKGANKVKGLGGTFESYTTRDQTVFLAKVFNKDVPKAVEIMSDILVNPQISQGDINEERPKTISSIDNCNNCVVGSNFDYLHSVAFQGNALCFTVKGKKENIERFATSDIENYQKEQFTGNRVSVAAAGNVSSDDFKAMVEKSFSSVAPSEKVQKFTGKSPYVGSAVTIMDDSHHYFDAIIGYEGASYSSPDYIPLLLIEKIIGSFNANQLSGNRSSSRLNEVIAMDHLAESFNAFNIFYQNTGLFGVYFRADSHTADDLCNEIISELVRLAKSASARELELAKNQLKSSILSYNGVNHLCKEIGSQLNNFNRTVSASELFARIDAVNVDTIRNVAERRFTHVEPVSVASGDIYHFPDYNQLRSWTYWNRL